MWLLLLTQGMVTWSGRRVVTSNSVGRLLVAMSPVGLETRFGGLDENVTQLPIQWLTQTYIAPAGFDQSLCYKLCHVVRYDADIVPD